MKPSGAHTHPGGGPGLGLAVIVALVLVVAGSAGAAFHTAEHALDVLVHIVLIVLAIVAGLTLVGLGAAVLIRRHYEKDAASWRATVQPLATRAARARTAAPELLPAQPKQAAVAPVVHYHVHLHAAPAALPAVPFQRPDRPQAPNARHPDGTIAP
jgi:hypothetical protein